MITGPELKVARKAAGLNQTQMGKLIGCSRHAISYWEVRTAPLTRKQVAYGVPKVYLEALGIEILPYSHTSARARGGGVLQGQVKRQEARAAQTAARFRQPCGAKTRKGQPCRNMSVAGRRRCKFHGGLSTGPRTAEGKKRIAEAQRLRWAKFRQRPRQQ